MQIEAQYKNLMVQYIWTLIFLQLCKIKWGNSEVKKKNEENVMDW